MDKISNNQVTRSYLSFQLGDELFAADVSKVLEILELRPITRVPKAPDYMRGVINLRGSVLPVLDTRIKFGFLAKEDTVDTCIVVLHVNLDGDLITLGAMVDSVEEVLELTDEQIELPPSIGSKFNPEYLKGMYRNDDHFIMILDVDKVFSTGELRTTQSNLATIET